jgi:hypothetical protein
VIIAHSDLHQALFDKRNVSIGVQMEIARLVSSEKIKWDDITIKSIVDHLCNDNRTSAPLVEEVLCQREMTMYRTYFEEEISSKVCDIPTIDII